MQERDDITLILRGLLDASKLDSNLWNVKYLGSGRENDFFHKFRRFDRTVEEDGHETYTERDKMYSMQFKEFERYCNLRTSCLKLPMSHMTAENSTFTFEDHVGKNHTVDVWSTVFYLIDLDMKRMFPTLHDNFLEAFDLPAVLPGGSNCLLNCVSASARPLMGPNLYVTPPASFTYFHQDGHGTVDSGHLCIQGYNEVIILRRVTERHKKHALWILSGSKNDGSYFDGLYSEPHGDNLGKKPKWATNEMIDECKRMG
jgi:hypothetical protein